MSWSKVMFAVPSPHDIGPAEIEKVGRIAAALDAQLELFHCVFDAGFTAPAGVARATAQGGIRQLVSNRQRGLERLAERFRARGVRALTSVRWDHPLYEGIVRQVLRHRPRLLIVRSSRRGRAERLFLSHTDWKLIETCPCPLLLLKTRRSYAKPLVLAAVDPGHAHDKPAALDEEILDSAGLLSDALSARLEVFHARTPWDEATRMDPELRDLPEYRDEEIHRAYLKRVETTVLELAERHNITQQQVHVEDGPAAEALPRYASQSRADIIVMGAVSRSPLRRAVIGHTAERVLDALNTDILILKPPGFRTTVSPQSTHHVASTAELRPRLMW
jgi:universal stress protein E